MGDFTQGIPKEFIKVTDPAEEDLLFREGLRIQASAILWTNGQRHLIKGNLLPKRIAQDRFCTVASEETDIPRLTLEMAASGLRDFFFSVSLSRANILFRSTYLGFNGDGMHFRNPEALYKVQRRKDVRLVIRDGYVLKLSYTHPNDPTERLTRKVYDLSAGGVAILIPELEAGDYPPGTLVREINFTIAQREIIAEASVRYCKPFSRNNLSKVGLLFESISPSDSQFIGRYVMEQNLHLMSRFT